MPVFDQITQFEAIELFASRASAVQSQFALTAHNALDVARVCSQLDGIPLAIELAAAWVRTLPIDQISRRLGENIDFLRGASRTALPRHQTLRACLDWSYDLLSPGEQDLLQALSVFAGGWTLEAAEVVCAGSCELRSKSWISSTSWLPEPGDCRTSSRDRNSLSTAGAGAPVCQREAARFWRKGSGSAIGTWLISRVWCAGQTTSARPPADRMDACLERELGNIRVALDWSYSEDGPMERVENGLCIAADLHWFWQCRNRHLEGFQHLSRLLDLEQQRRGDQQLSQSMCLARAWALKKYG